MKKTYILNPTMTFNTLTSVPAAHKPCERTVDEIVTAIMPDKPAAVPAHKPRFVPPFQPLPCASLVAERPALKLGLDVHLEFIMVVAQRGHLSPQAPRKFTRPSNWSNKSSAGSLKAWRFIACRNRAASASCCIGSWSTPARRAC